MKERHAAELKAFQQRLISKTSTPKFSKELLNLRKIQDVLAKKKECVVLTCLHGWACVGVGGTCAWGGGTCAARRWAPC